MPTIVATCLSYLKQGVHFPHGLDSKESACNEGDPGSVPGLRRSPWRREWQPTPVFLPGEFHGQRSLVGYSPWSHKRSDTTERLTLSLVRNVELRSYHQPEEFRKGQKEREGSSPYVLPMSQNPLRWNPSWLSEAQLTRKDPESE